MKIAQVAPLYESVPPKLYGGTERVVSYLTDELVGMGHDVTLFASGDSTTSARLVPCCDKALRLDSRCVDPLAHHMVMLERVLQRAHDFDVIHFHCDYLHFPLTTRHATASVTTLHGRLDLPDLVPLYREFELVPVISISHAQREPLPWLNWQRTVYHGLPGNLYQFRPERGKYLAFLGRTSPEKGLDKAIEIAKRTGMELRIAAKVDRVDQQYFREVIQPLLKHPLIHFVGEINDSEKVAFLGDALALLVPVNWPEPFGLVMIEALACGTPVIAFRRGSIPEIVNDGESGFIVDDLDGATQAVQKALALDRKKCRHAFDRRFTAARMAQNYLETYRRLTSRERAGLCESKENKLWMTSSVSKIGTTSSQPRL
jgi:glycosyltransferase involved in cell wall biosynthesis